MTANIDATGSTTGSDPARRDAHHQLQPQNRLRSAFSTSMKRVIRPRTPLFCALDGRIKPSASWAPPTAWIHPAFRCWNATSCGPATNLLAAPDPFDPNRAVLVWDALQTDNENKDVYATYAVLR
jgi:hypothetical protein